jgi:hypothetical protein
MLSQPYPVAIELVVYNLLPEGLLATLSYYAGCGIYHSSIRIPSLEVEVAFGAFSIEGSKCHANPNAGGGPQASSGIFAVPTSAVIPGLRYLQTIPLGAAFQHLQTSEGSGREDSDGREPLLQDSQQEAMGDTLARILEVVETLRNDETWAACRYDLLKR